MRALADLAPLRLRKVLRQMLQPVGQPLLGRGTIGKRQNLGRGNRVARIVQPAPTGQSQQAIGTIQKAQSAGRVWGASLGGGLAQIGGEEVRGKVGEAVALWGDG